MTKKDETGIYIGRFLTPDGEDWEYRTAFIQNVNRTIPEYGLNLEWVKAQQVISFINSGKTLFIGKIGEKLNPEDFEIIHYDSVFPEMTMREATNIILEYNQ